MVRAHTCVAPRVPCALASWHLGMRCEPDTRRKPWGESSGKQTQARTAHRRAVGGELPHLACTRKTSLPPHRDTRSTRQRASVVAPRRHPPHMPPHMPTHIHAPRVAHMDGGGVLTHGWPTCRRIPVAHTHTCHPPTQASEMSVRCSDARGCSSVLTKAYRHRRTRTGRQTVSSSSAAEQQQCRSAHACSCGQRGRRKRPTSRKR